MVEIEFQLLDKEFNQAVKEAIEACDDLTIPFTGMIESWFKSNRAIFSLKTAGKYKDLTPKYKKVKVRKFGFVYPILKATGRLADSITKPGNVDSIAKIINKKTLLLGSKTPYGGYHQFGTSVLPIRPWILLGAEQVSPPDINRRRDNWIKLLQEHVLSKAKKIGGG